MVKEIRFAEQPEEDEAAKPAEEVNAAPAPVTEEGHGSFKKDASLEKDASFDGPAALIVVPSAHAPNSRGA